MQAFNITEWIAIFGLLVAGFAAWLKINTTITRIDADLSNLKDEFKEEKKSNYNILAKLEEKLDDIYKILINLNKK
jgi:hypothetical protein